MIYNDLESTLVSFIRGELTHMDGIPCARSPAPHSKRLSRASFTEPPAMKHFPQRQWYRYKDAAQEHTNLAYRHLR